MDYNTFDTIKKTADSYIEAVQKLTDIFPKLPRYGLFGGTGGGMRHEFATYPQPCDAAMQHATSVTAGYEPLVDLGRAKDVRTTSDVWTYRFFRVRFEIEIPFQEYGMVAPRQEAGNEDTGEPGKYTPATERSETRHLVCAWDGARWGLRDWKIRASEIKSYCDVCADDVNACYALAYEKACKEVELWEKAMAESRAVVIPS